MASSYTGLGTELMTTGENAGTWGSTTNTNLQIIEQISGGYTAQSIAGSAQTTTLSVSDGSTGATLAHRVIEFTGTITGNQVVTVPLDVQTFYIMKNNTSGAYTVQFKYVSGSGSSVTWAATDKGTKLIYATADDGTNPNIVDSGIGSTAGHDLDGNELILDADADTSITADTDDQIDIKIAGADDFQFTANTFTAQSGSTIAAQALTATTITASGIVKTDDTTAATSTTDGSLQTDGGLSVAADAVIGDDLKLLSDSAVLSFGADSDTTLTHTDGTGLTLNSTNKLCFYDTALSISSSTDGQLDIDADTEVEIATTTLDLNGALDVSGASQFSSTITVGVNDTGYDVKFFGATSGAYMLWDESTDDLVLAGAAKLYLYDAAGGEYLSSSGSALTIASGSAAWELPAADGSDGQLLKTDGSGNLDWTTVSGTITALNNATANEIVTVGSTTTELDAEGNFTYDGNNAALTSSVSTNPIISVTNTNTDANGSILRFIKDAGEAGAANDISGLVSFYADDADQNNQEFGRITGRVVDATAGGEEGALDFYVAEYDGTVTKGMEIKGLASDGNITVDISTHDGSAGGLMLASTLVTATATELNLMDGGTTAGTTAVASGDGIVTNDGGTMRQTTVATFDTYLSGSTQTLTNKTLTAPKFADAGYIADANGNELVILQTTSSAVNQFDVANAATGNDPTITATGGDSNVGLGIVAKGSGVIQITTSMNPTLTSTGKSLVLGF